MTVIPQATADKIRQIAEAANAEIARIEAEPRGYDSAAINRECLEALIEQTAGVVRVGEE